MRVHAEAHRGEVRFPKPGGARRRRLLPDLPELAINPVAPLQRKNRFFIYSNETVQVQCDPGAIDGYMLAEAAGVETKLRVGSVLALRKGRRLTDSGTAVFPVTGADGKPDGTQTIAYSISVKRVR